MIPLVAKVTLLLCLGAVAALLLRKRSAATRHFVWTLSLASALALPLFMPFAPPVTATIEVELPQAVQPLAPPEELSRPLLPAPEVGEQPAIAKVVSQSLIPKSTMPTSLGIALYLWLVVLGALLFRALVGHAGLMRLAYHANPFDTVRLRMLLLNALEKSGVTKAVVVATSSEVGAPFTYGWFEPVILLPDDAKEWPEDRLRVVLMHELAHVARYDYVTHLIGHLACAVYWFHPLVWIAAKRLRTESEHACDDRVLDDDGTPAPDYATHLLDVARAARSRLVDSIALCMARPSHLEDRVRAVLDDSRPRRAVPPALRMFAIVVLALLMVPFAGFRARTSNAARLEPLVAQRPTPRPEPMPEPDPEVEVDVDDEPLPPSPRRMDVRSGGSLTVEFHTGADVTIKGWDQQGVKANVPIEVRDNRARLTDPNVSVDQMEFFVPHRFDIRIQSAGGDITIADVEGRLTGSTGGGEIHLTRITGTTHLSTGGGDITVSKSTLDGNVSTGGGAVTFTEVAGNLKGSSGSGPVTYERDGILHMESAGGDIVLDSAPRGAILDTGGGDVEVGRSNGRIVAQTGGGDIKVGPLAGAVRATTGSGDVEVVIVETDAEQNVDISSGNGDVKLVLPSNFSGSFDLRSDGNEGQEIRTAFPLEMHDKPGIHRASGTVGSGKNRVRVRTSNGDITILKK